MDLQSLARLSRLPLPGCVDYAQHRDNYVVIEQSQLKKLRLLIGNSKCLVLHQSILDEYREMPYRVIMHPEYILNELQYEIMRRRYKVWDSQLTTWCKKIMERNSSDDAIDFFSFVTNARKIRAYNFT